MAEGEHLLLSARERAGATPLGNAEDREQVEHPIDAPAQVGAVAPVGEATHLEILQDRHLAEDAAAAGQEVDTEAGALLGCGVGDGPTVEAHHAPIGGDQSRRDTQRRRLAGTVGAQQRQDLAALHLEVRRRRGPGRARS